MWKLECIGRGADVCFFKAGVVANWSRYIRANYGLHKKKKCFG